MFDHDALNRTFHCRSNRGRMVREGESDLKIIREVRWQPACDATQLFEPGSAPARYLVAPFAQSTIAC